MTKIGGKTQQNHKSM